MKEFIKETIEIYKIRDKWTPEFKHHMYAIYFSLFSLLVSIIVLICVLV